MKYLHQIGDRTQLGRPNPNFNTLSEILAYQGPISFDGIYESVYTHYKALKGKDVTFFFSGKYVGEDNQFDVHTGQPLTRFCDYDQIREMADYLGARLGYHGWAHRRCVGLTRDELVAELSPPQCLRIWTATRGQHLWLAWPYGDFDDEAIRVAKWLGYDGAYSCMQGDERNLFAQPRTMLNW